MTSERSSAVKSKLDTTLKMIEGSDYDLQEVLQVRKQGGTVIAYHSRTIRNDLVDDDGTYAMMNKREYALANIYRILCDHDVVQHIRDLKDDGLVSDDDLAAL